MSDARRIEIPKRTDACVRAVIGSWRALTGGPAVRDGGRRTLVACSGGADSSALLLALSAVRPGPEACHVVHDMRPRAQSMRDADRTAALCASLGVPFHLESVAVAEAPGNAEANARDARYGVLERVARARGLRYVATGHHADDQLETVLMRLLRGAGVRGMAGIRPSRALGDGVTLVRPMLGVTGAEARAVCERAGWVWNEDATNADSTRLRAALRQGVLPALRAVDPEAARRAARTCASMASADEAIEVMARGVLAGAQNVGGVVVLQPENVVVLPDAVLARLIGMVYHRIVGSVGQDRLSQRLIATCIGGIRGPGSGVSTYNLFEMELRICKDSIEFCKKCR